MEDRIAADRTVASCRLLRDVLLNARVATDEPIDLDRERDGIVAEVMGVRAAADAELGPVIAARGDDVAGWSHCGDAEHRLLCRCGPNRATYIITRAIRVDPLGQLEFTSRRMRRSERRWRRAHPSIQEGKERC